MSSVQCLRDFVHERLTAAAEEIFRVFEQTVLEYEEEIDRQRRLLDIAWKPEIKLHRTVSELRPPELPEQHVCKEEKLLTDQERNPSLDQEDREPPQIKEEQEELCTSQEGEQLVLKQEDDTFMLTSPYEGSDHSEPEPTSEQQLLSHISPGAESRAQRGSEHVDPGPTRDEESQRNNSPPTQSHCSTHTGRRASACDTCGKAFRSNSDLKRHMRIHTELPEQHVCKEEELLTDQERNPSLDQEDPEPPQIKEEQEELCTSQEGEQLVLKQIQTFMLTSPYEGSDHTEPTSEQQLLSHISPGAEIQAQRGSEHVDPGPTRDEESQRNNSPPTQSHCSTHTGKTSFSCDTCGKVFMTKSKMNTHVRIHTGEKSFSCDTVKRVGQNFSLLTTRHHPQVRSRASAARGKNLHSSSLNKKSESLKL
ncbi:zinc finger and SCAN domain-containing protein 12 isoform X2 [Pleuronectes platessa]|uniref:zinc finger and SCAN domain-containing protein 12 isoform X2 n=1 Tax=Pleuronectes platessa TaxID=8262 RepID=UPI00232A1250|nr:zinc finger and SCAN domain-containing protein 12 isoform X2 [Pleuronectes platessa]XP_053294490.1 zinc finger and SCAN domain-containing protein 12 isoform X2 [Pleuronectes platessa]XP_053294491.1 zinc finger and SCAN domain-containing protein 12 isoform X2 [Pleuronectes platessa]